MAVVGRSDYFTSEISKLYRGASPVVPATLYIGFVTAGPSVLDGTGLVELVASDYSRKVVTFDPPTSREMRNSAVINFVSSAATAWNGGQAIKRFALWSAVTGGNLLHIGELAPILTVSAGAPVVINVGAIVHRDETFTVAD